MRNRSAIASTANKLLNELKNLTKYDLWYYYVLYEDEEETKLVREIRTQAVTAIATTWQESPTPNPGSKNALPRMITGVCEVQQSEN